MSETSPKNASRSCGETCLVSQASLLLYFAFYGLSFFPESCKVTLGRGCTHFANLQMRGIATKIRNFISFTGVNINHSGRAFEQVIGRFDSHKIALGLFPSIPEASSINKFLRSLISLDWFMMQLCCI